MVPALGEGRHHLKKVSLVARVDQVEPDHLLGRHIGMSGRPDSGMKRALTDVGRTAAGWTRYARPN